MMGLQSSRAKEFVTDVLDEYRRLDEKRLRSTLTSSEISRLRNLQNTLRSLPSEDPVRLTTELENLASRVRAVKRVQA